MSRLETEVLTHPENLEVLMEVPGKWLDQVRRRKPLKRPVLDMDRSVSPTHRDQEGTAYTGHLECTCYHPLFLFSQHGDLVRVLLRNGNVNSADDWHFVLEQVIARYRKEIFPGFFRADAAFANP